MFIRPYEVEILLQSVLCALRYAVSTAAVVWVPPILID